MKSNQNNYEQSIKDFAKQTQSMAENATKLVSNIMENAKKNMTEKEARLFADALNSAKPNLEEGILNFKNIIKQWESK
jgi:F0F1-type ATP synthase membrane subunit b/b'